MWGAPIIKGTRVRIKVLLDNLAEGHTVEQIVKFYPSLTHDDVRAVIAFAAASFKGDISSSPKTVLFGNSIIQSLEAKLEAWAIQKGIKGCRIFESE